MLDKPKGLSSNGALQRVKHAYQAAKAGHTGSLDPLATGVLPICLGNATKLAAYLLDADKRYRATVRLGISTATGDAEGEAIAHSDPAELEADALIAAGQTFLGPQKQVPPMYSALKRNGRPLYELARKGIEVERPARDITIHQLEVISQDADSFTFEVTCSKGTYIRTLAEDWCAAVGQCGHLSTLRRTGFAHFDESSLMTLDEIEAASDLQQRDALLRPLSCLLEDWPRVCVTTQQAQHLVHGQSIRLPAPVSPGRLAVFDATSAQVLCIAQADESGHVIAPRRWIRFNRG